MEANVPAKRPPTPMQKYGGMVEAIASKELTRIFTGPDGAAAAAQVALAFRSAVAQAENPDALLNCSEQSIAMCVANSARYRILPGGSNPGVYLVPKAGALGWWLNARGMCDLAERSGRHLDVKPVYKTDEFVVEYGLNPRLVHTPKPGPKTWDTLAGVYVIVRDLATGRPIDMVYMERDEIQQRRAAAGTQKVWNAWPIPQAMKTAIKYAVARGMVILNEESRAAMTADAEWEEETAPRRVVEPEEAPKPLRISEASSTLDSILNEPAERVAVPVTGPHIATLTAAGLSWSEVCEWYAETQGKDPNDWTDADKAAFAADVAANPANFKASPFYTGGGR